MNERHPTVILIREFTQNRGVENEGANHLFRPPSRLGESRVIIEPQIAANPNEGALPTQLTSHSKIPLEKPSWSLATSRICLPPIGWKEISLQPSFTTG